MVSILNQNEDIFELVLDEKVILTHDTNRYRFKLPNENDVLGLPVGKHLSLIGLDNEGEQVSRSYTPVSTDSNKGYVDFVIKTYKKDQHPDFPDGGFMSQKVDALNIGETFKFKGPNGRLEYLGNVGFWESTWNENNEITYATIIIENSLGGTVFLTTILHEIGNVLGLGDISPRQDIRSIQEDPFQENFVGSSLWEFDVQMIKQLYDE